MNTYNRKDVTFKSGEGVWLYDIADEAYLDFVSGVAVNSLGHSYPKMVEAMKAQVEKLVHVSNLYWTKEQDGLGMKLAQLSGLEAAFFCNSGTEAVEGAFKLARKYGAMKSETKNKVVVLENAFHGRTMGALSLTWNSAYKKPFEPLVQNINAVKLNDLEGLKAVMSEEVCAVIIEPIQGEGGIHVATFEFLNEAKTLCETFDALLVFDEVQCGIGRSGHTFAYQATGIVPDILCLAKGLGAGMPIGAVVAGEKANVFAPGDHGSTFGGNPLACTAGLVVLDELEHCSLTGHVQSASDYLVQGLKNLNEKLDFLLEIRGEGLLLGIETKYESKLLIEKAMEEKLLLIGAGQKTVRLLPPLNITFDEIDVFFEKFSSAIVKASAEADLEE